MYAFVDRCRSRRGPGPDETRLARCLDRERGVPVNMIDRSKNFYSNRKIVDRQGDEEMTFETNKNLSGIGALFIVIGFIGSLVPYVGLLALIGVILLLIGLKGLSNYYKEEGIFNNALYSIISAIVGGVVAVAALAITAVSALASIGFDFNDINDWATVGSEIGSYFANLNFNAIWALISAVVLAVVILFVFAIISTYFFRKSMDQLSSKTGVGLFGTAGLLMLIGAVLSIIAVGLLLIWVGFILATIAFFQMKEKQT